MKKLLPLLALVLLAGCSTPQPQFRTFERVDEIDSGTGEVIASYNVVDGHRIDPDAPGDQMIQSGIDTMIAPEPWYAGWFNFFSPTKEEYAHAMVHNGTVVNLYAQHIKAWSETTIDLPGPDGTTYSIPFGSAPRASDYLAYLYNPQSGSQRFGLDAQSGLSYLSLGGGFWLAGKGIDAASDANARANDSFANGVNTGANITNQAAAGASQSTVNAINAGAGLAGQ